MNRYSQGYISARRESSEIEDLLIYILVGFTFAVLFGYLLQIIGGML